MCAPPGLSHLKQKFRTPTLAYQHKYPQAQDLRKMHHIRIQKTEKGVVCSREISNGNYTYRKTAQDKNQSTQKCSWELFKLIFVYITICHGQTHKQIITQNQCSQPLITHPDILHKQVFLTYRKQSQKKSRLQRCYYKRFQNSHNVNKAFFIK